MYVIGRIKNTVYINIQHARIISEAILKDLSDLEFIPEYSSMYFIELEAYGESQFPETIPETQADFNIKMNQS